MGIGRWPQTHTDQNRTLSVLRCTELGTATGRYKRLGQPPCKEKSPLPLSVPLHAAPYSPQPISFLLLPGEGESSSSQAQRCSCSLCHLGNRAAGFGLQRILDKYSSKGKGEERESQMLLPTRGWALQGFFPFVFWTKKNAEVSSFPLSNTWQSQESDFTAAGSLASLPFQGNQHHKDGHHTFPLVFSLSITFCLRIQIA